MEDAKLSSRPELEEGEIEDSSSEHDLLVDEQPGELAVEDGNDEQVVERVDNSGSSQVTVQKVKDKTAQKKIKVRVIKRIIKVIRKKPKLEGQNSTAVSRDVPKKLKVSHQTKCRQDDETPDSYRNTRIRTEPGSEQTAGTSPRSTNPSKSNARSSVPAKVKREPSAAVLEPADLTSVSEKSLNQMEILELEMRARAIKAMLKKQEEKEKCVEPESKRRIKLKRKITEN